MKFLISLFIWNISWTIIKAQNCLPEGAGLVGNIYNSPEIYDTARGELITFTVTGVTGAIITSSGNWDQYFELSDPDGDQVTVSLSDAFENFENDVASNSETINVQFSINIAFTCSGTTQTGTLLFYQTVIDTNNHDPEFSQSIYTYDVPIPFPAVIDITLLGVDIIVTDIDISNSGITFEIDPSDTLRIEYGGVVDELNKQHRATIYPLQTLEFTTSQTFTITAADTGDQPRRSTAELVIQVDTINSVEATPEFGEAYYSVAYDNSENTHIAVAEIAVTDAYAVNVQTDYEEYFDIQFNEETGIANVQLIKNFDDTTIEENAGSSIPIVITAVSESETRSSHTVLILEMPESEATPAFTETFYTAVYDNSGNTHTAEATITVTDASEVRVETSYAEYFNVDFVPGTGEATVQLVRNFDDTMIEERVNDYIPILITAVSASGTRSSETVLIVKMPEREETPEFAEAFYSVNYDNSEETHTVEATVTVTDAYRVSIETGYEEYFEVTFTPGTEIVNVQLIKNFEDEIIEERAGDSIPIVITAASEFTTKSSRTVLLVKIPASEPTPIFVEAYYSAVYDNSENTHRADAEITVTDAYDVSVETGYEEYFEVTFTPGTEIANVQLIKNFEDEIIEERAGDSIPIVITAVSEFTTKSSRTVLLVQIPASEPTPIFVEAFYSAVYDNSENTHRADAEITVTDAYDVSVETGYEEYFDVTFTPGTEIAIVQLIKNFEDETIEESAGNSIPIVITAVSELTTKSSRTVLLVMIPASEPTPVFVEAYYSAVYDNSENTHRADAEIAVTDAYDVSVETAYEENFEVTFNRNTGIANVNLVKNFEDATIQERAGHSIPIVITAVSESETKSSETVLIVEMPENEATPEFAEAFYIATYDNTDEIHTAEAVIIVTDAFTVSVETGYEVYDTVSSISETGTATIELIRNFNDVFIEERAGDSLPIAIMATSESGTRSIREVLLVKIIASESTPAFNEVYYSVEYDNRGETHTAEIDISVTDVFLVSVETTNVDLVKNLDDVTIEERAGDSIPIVITAVSESGTTSSGTILIIQMPESEGSPEDEETPEFAEAYYNVVYNNNAHIHTAETIVTITGASDIRLVTGANFEDDTIEERAGDSIPIVITAFSESGTRSSRTILILEMPESGETPEDEVTPEFAEPYYNVVYNNNGDTHIAQTIMTVTGASYFSVESDYVSFFEVTFTDEPNQAIVQLLRNFEDDTIEERAGDSIPIVITAFSESGTRSSRTILILEMPESGETPEDEVTPEFAEPYYNVVYNNNGDTHIAQTIMTVTGASYFSVESDYVSFFEVTFTDEPNQAIVQLLRNFEDDTIEERAGDSIPIVITAFSESGTRSSRTILILEMPESGETPEDEVTPEFAEPYYNVVYNNNGDTHIAQTIMTVTGASYFSVESDYVSFFEVTFTDEPNQAIVQLLRNFEDDTIEERAGDSIPIVITAFSESGTRSSRTILILQMPESAETPEDEATPEFVEPYYNVVYNNNGDIHTAETIMTVTGASYFSVESDYVSFFEVTFTDEPNQAIVQLLRNFEDDTIEERAGDSIPIVITAFSESGTRSSRTILILQMPESAETPEDEATPEFVEPYYNVVYNNNGDIHTAETIMTVTGASYFSVESDYVSFFEVTFTDEPNQAIVQLLRNFEDDAIEERAGDSIPIVITAFSESGTRSSRTILILQMPESAETPEDEATPEFVEPYYNVVYNNNGDIHTAETIMTVTGASYFSVESDYVSFFEVTFTDEPNQANVQLLRNFEDDTIEDRAGDSIPIVITAFSESGTRSSRTILILQMPESAEMPEDEATPEFVEPYYNVVYNNNGDIHTAETIMTVTGASYFSVESDYVSFFEVTFTDEPNQAIVQLLRNFEDDTIEERAGDSIPIVITAYSESGTRSSRTILILQMPENAETPEDEATPEFVEPYYNVVYNNNGDIHTAETIMTVTGASYFSVESDYVSFFEVTFTDEPNQAIVQLLRNFEDDTIEERAGDSIPIVITAFSESGTRSSRTILILQMPESAETPEDEATPEFVEPYYNVVYNNNGDIHTAETIMTVTGASYFGVESDYVSFFEVTFTDEPDQAIVQLLRNFEDDTIEERAGDSIPIVITAFSESGTRSSRTILILQMPESAEMPEDEATPEFVEPYYNVVYNNNGDIHTAETIMTVTGASYFSVESDYVSFFEVTFTDEPNQAIVQLLRNFEDDTIEERAGDSIPIVITAFSESGTRSSRTILILQMPENAETPEDEATPEFVEPYYNVVYNNNGDIHTAETIMTVTGASYFSVESDYVSFFEVTFTDEPNQAIVQLLRNFEDDTIEERAGDSIPIVITAFSESGTRSSRTILILEMPESGETPEDEVTPEFAEPYYNVVYNNNGDTHIAQTIMTVTGASYFSVESDYVSFFEVTFTDEPNQAIVQLLRNFEDDTIEERAGDSIPIVITAFSESGTRSSRTILILEMPESGETPEDEVTPEFAEPYYNVVYNNNGDTHIAQTIMTVTGASYFSVESDYVSFFEVTFTDEPNQAIVQLLRNFEDDTIEERAGDSIPIVITAFSESGTRSSRTILILEMPESGETPEDEVTPEFAEPYYNIVYNNNGDTHIAQTIMTVTGASYFSVESDYVSFFEVTFTDEPNQAIVQLLRNFEDDTIEERAGDSIPIVITAFSESGTRSSRTILILEMPESGETPEDEVTPEFAEPYYNVVYNNNGDTHIAQTIMTVTGASYFSVETDYVSFFEVTFTDEPNQAIVQLLRNFEDDTIEERAGDSIPIVITAFSESGTRSSRTILIVQMPEDEVTPEFAEAYYSVLYDNSEDIHIAETVITVTDAAVVSVETVYEEYFEVTFTAEPDIANVQLIRNFDDQTIEETLGQSIPIVVTAISEFETRFSRTVLILQMPEVTYPDDEITFERAVFEFRMSATETFTGQSGVVLSAVSTMDETIMYSADDRKPAQLDYSTTTGLLTNNDFLQSGTYDFTISATGSTTGLVGTATVTITITAIEICDNGPNLIYSYFRKTIQEGVAESDVVVIPLDEVERYELSIISVEPSEGQDLFEVGTEGIICSELNREATHLADMSIAQYTIVIRIDDTTETDATSYIQDYRKSIFGLTGSTRATDDECVLVDTILTDSSQMTITVIVGDENDNNPVFSTSSMVVGYPLKYLLSSVSPQYLVQVEATDADIGVNAELAYSVVGSDSRVIIHPSTGVIYPTEMMIDDEQDFRFSVIATDQNGLGLPSEPLEIQVKFLDTEHISVITLENVYLEDLEEKIAELNTIANANIQTIQNNVLPRNILSSQSSANEIYYLTLISYALDAADNLLTSDDLKESLDGTDNLSIKTLDESGLLGSISEGPTVLYSHFQTTIQEGVRESVVIDILLQEETYELNIISVEPSEGQALFQVGTEGIICFELDREATHLADMSVAHYTIVVQIIDTAETDATSYVQEYRKSILGLTGSTRATDDECILVDTILTDSSQMTITVIVGDENDNNPVFSTSSMVVGYPLKYLLSSVSPQYLVQVEATDADIGVNAELAYAVIDSDSRVIIHPSTGVIYPTEIMIDDEDDFTFTIIATDQNGVGLSSEPLEIEVKFLDTEHISVITLENIYLEDLEEKIAELNTRANVNIQALQSKALPTDSLSRQSRADEVYYLTVISYAFDTEDNLLTSDDLKDLLDNVANLSIETLDESGLLSSVIESSKTGWIAAVSVLSVLLGLVIIGVLAFYFLVLRKAKPYEQMKDEQSTPPPSTMYQKNIQTARSSSKITHDIEKPPSRRSTGVTLSGPIIGDSDDAESPPQQRKSVVFNENVEQINVHMPQNTDDDNIESSRL